MTQQLSNRIAATVVPLANSTTSGLVGGTSAAQTLAPTLTLAQPVIVGGNTTSDSNLGTISSVSLGQYYEGTFSLTFSGAFTSSPITFTYRKIGKTVTLSFPTIQASATSAATLASTTSMPSALEPNQLSNFPVFVIDAGTTQAQMGALTISTGGTITFFKTFTGSGTFSNSGTAGPYALTISYITSV